MNKKINDNNLPEKNGESLGLGCTLLGLGIGGIVIFYAILHVFAEILCGRGC